MRDFVYHANPSRVIFGSGSISRLAAEIERLGLKRVLLLCTASREGDAEDVRTGILQYCVGIHAGAVMHTPVDATARAIERLQELRVDGLVALGGGSAIGLAKAIALRTDLPQIAVPTTYAGSEMTPILGETKDGQKVTQSSPKVLPEVVIYDARLTLGLAPHVSATSGMNAIAHAVEALYARDRNPIISMLALEGVRSLATALPFIANRPDDLEARGEAQYGAWLCGTCLGAVGMALHHKLCHTLGGTFGLPHAETHAILLPHALAYNAHAAPEAITRLAEVLGDPDPARALFLLGGKLGIPRSLRDLGMPESGLERAADQALANPYWNPRPLEHDAIYALLQRAWSGEAPLDSRKE